MKILGKNIQIIIPKAKEIFENDPTKVFGKIVGIGEDVSIDIAIGDTVYFHPAGLTLIHEEEWDVIQESSVICKKGQ